MDCNYYKYCMVPQCESTTVKTPKKLFIHVPKKEQIRKKWLLLARRDQNLSATSRMYFCEDHFDLPKDMDNYVEYHIMGSVGQIRMKPGCMPTKFDCQSDRRKKADDSLEKQFSQKKRRKMIVEECLNKSGKSNTSDTSGTNSIPSDTSPDFLQLVQERTVDKSIQVLITHKYRSKAIQNSVKQRDKASSPVNFTNISSTPPYKIRYCMKPRSSGYSKREIPKGLIKEENSDTDIDDSLYKAPIDSVPPVKSPYKSPSEFSDFIEETLTQKSLEALQYPIEKIISNPHFYIGVPSTSYFIIDLISEETNIPTNHILLCLKKIRLDNHFQELADDFDLTSPSASEIFMKNIPIIASVMRAFIVKLGSESNIKTLPMEFGHKFHNVSCIMDCLEINIQKPSKAVYQTLTWSDCKKANTIKYLISCTPGGLVNYISPGIGGKISDTCLIKACDFIQNLEKGTCAVADRGFDHIEQHIQNSEVQLVQPPTVKAGCKLNKCEEKQTKQLADLRIHVERVVTRLHEFKMLQPHSCINSNYLKILDDIVTIACGIINLQHCTE